MPIGEPPLLPPAAAEPRDFAIFICHCHDASFHDCRLIIFHFLAAAEFQRYFLPIFALLPLSF